MAKKATKKPKHLKARKIASYVIGVSAVVASLFLLTHDWQRKNKCEWYLIPDTSEGRSSDEGMIPVCARNYEIHKQNCRLQAKMGFAKKYFKKKFRLDEMQLSSKTSYPKEVVGITVCEQ